MRCLCPMNMMRVTSNNSVTADNYGNERQDKLCQYLSGRLPP
uniref:Uncharacterized protein n=1 Tax=Musa acuminata subsp. malaccensis TaxID=214687 RepID=A0A804JPC0_MUSAM